MTRRVEQVEQVVSKEFPCLHLGGPGYARLKAHVATLLRRELAKERGRVSKLLKIERDRMKPGAYSVTNNEKDDAWLNGHRRACTNLLAALRGRKK
jgi:hypothetical protein